MNKYYFEYKGQETINYLNNMVKYILEDYFYDLQEQKYEQNLYNSNITEYNNWDRDLFDIYLYWSKLVFRH